EIAGQLERLRYAAPMMRHDPGGRIDREGENFLRRLVRNFLDVHAAFGRDNERDARGFAINQRRKIELAIDCRAFLDIEAVDLLAVRAGLVRHQRRTQNACGLFLHVIDGFHHLDAAGFAAPTCVDLGLYNPNRAGKLLRALDRFIDAECGDAPRHRHTEFAQHRLRLIFVDIHAELPAERAGFFLVVEIGGDLFAGIDQALHRGRRFFEHGALAAVELDLDDAFDTFGANDNRDADVQILD